MQKGYFDAIAVDRVKDFQSQLADFLSTRKEAVLASILKKGAIDAELEKELTAAVDEFKVIFR
jgi:F-type H+-transporting ATPase subunit alpha